MTHALDGWTDEERDTLRELLHRLVQTLLTQNEAQESTR
jgi:hypothetical protein